MPTRRGMLARMASPKPAAAASLTLADSVATGPPALSSSILSCPYLTSASRAWVASGPSRDHRCEAVTPAAALTIEKQRRLCLTADHETCATYVAALEARQERIAGRGDSQIGWGWVRTTPVVDGSVGLGASVAALVAERRGWQVIPAVALVAALGALGLSNIGRGTGSASPGPSTPVVAVASPTSSMLSGAPSAPSSPEPSTLPSASPTPATPTATPSESPATTPLPSARTTYTVKLGDSLYSISRKFGVSVSALKTLNGLTSNTIHAGLVLKVP